MWKPHSWNYTLFPFVGESTISSWVRKKIETDHVLSPIMTGCIYCCLLIKTDGLWKTILTGTLVVIEVAKIDLWSTMVMMMSFSYAIISHCSLFLSQLLLPLHTHALHTEYPSVKKKKKQGQITRFKHKRICSSVLFIYLFMYLTFELHWAQQLCHTTLKYMT